MERYPGPDEVLEALGDKVVGAISAAVAGAREDLATYRAVFPDFVADQSARGLLNWIHDRMWARAKASLDDVADVAFVDCGPTHDIWVGNGFRLRLKRHSSTGAIRAYPTQSALAFISQEPDLLSLIGTVTLNLTAGYEWDELSRTMGEAVISLRDGSFEDVIWMTTLPAESGGASITPIVPTGDGPTTPVIEVPRYDTTESEGSNSE